MGFSMICTNTGKNCGYTTWYEQRTEIIKIVVKYLETRIIEIQNELEKHTDEDECEYINGFPTIDYNYYIEKIQNKFIKPIKESKGNTLYSSDERIFKVAENPEMYHIKDAMSCFGVYGIHLLCRQGDCGGVYTVGESLEILQLLKKIKPYFDTSSEIYETVYTIKSTWSSPIYDIFNDSVTTLQPIRIS